MTIKTHPASCCTTQLSPAQPSSCYRLPGLQNLHLLVVAAAAARAGVVPAPAPGWVSTLLTPVLTGSRVGPLPVLPLRTPQHCNNTALIVTQAGQQSVPAWCGWCVLRSLVAGVCQPAPITETSLTAIFSRLSSAAGVLVARPGSAVPMLRARCLHHPPSTLGQPAPTSRTPETARKSGDLWKWA